MSPRRSTTARPAGSGGLAAARNVVPPGRPVTRREFLELSALAAGTAGAVGLVGAASASASVRDRPAVPPPGYVAAYPDGVMSGDPAPSGTVLHTRLAPPSPDAPLDGTWEVATDATFTSIVAGGPFVTDAASGYSVKVAVDGLASDRRFHYRFLCAGVASPSGRMRTSPAPGSSPDVLTFAWCSCQQRTDSLYNAHTAIAAEPDLDFWMHLGDYIYVNDVATLTVADYRARYQLFKQDARLQALQAAVPTVAMFDDGEFVNGIDRTLEPARLAAALQVWFENFPVIPPGGDPTRAYRPLRWGSLADVMMIDVRQYRDPAVEAIDTRTPDGRVIFEAGRTTLGAAQKAWLLDGLRGSTSTWKLLGNPYNLALWRLEDLDEPWPRPDGVHPNEGVYAPNEAWDDYWAERRQLLSTVADEGIDNLLSFSAHTHIWLAGSLRPDWDDPGSPVVGYDFTCGSLTADPDLVRQSVGNGTAPEVAFANFLAAGEVSRERNPHQAYVNFLHQGYGLATVTPTETVVEFKAIDTYDPDATPDLLARFVVPAGDPCGMTVEYFDEPAYGISGPVARPGHAPWSSDCPAPPASTPPPVVTPRFTG